MKQFYYLLFFLFVCLSAKAQYIQPGAIWPDDKGVHVNAHGGEILFDKDRYYWFGEFKSDTTSLALMGVTCFCRSC